MEMILELVLWGSLIVSIFAYGGYTVVGWFLMRTGMNREDLR